MRLGAIFLVVYLKLLFSARGMHPICFNIGPLPIHSFGLMMGLGFIAGLLSWIWLGKKEGKDYAYCSDLLFWIMISGILGARLADVVSDLPYYMQSPVRILEIWKGGLTYYGGFAAAGIAILLFARSKHEKLLSVSDFVITSLPLSHALGRVGCLHNGCCHGKIYNGFLAVRYPGYGYPDESIPWHDQYVAHLVNWNTPKSLPVVPVQLFETAFNLVLYLVLVWVYRRRTRDGYVSALYLLMYPVARFALEFLRGDERMVWPGGLDVAQIISIGLFAGGLVLLAWVSRSGTTRSGPAQN
jgi:phosphatidylglycerol:prolipoprotein diacylglycerol transferase